MTDALHYQPTTLAPPTVYIVRGEASGRCKIGYTRDLKSRLSTIMATSPETIEVVRLFDGGRSTEKWLHDHFTHARIVREWFSFDPEMLTVSPPEEEVLPVIVRRPAVEVLRTLHPATKVTTALYQETVTKVLRECFGDTRAGTRKLANIAGVTTRTAQNWLNGINAPQGATLIRLEAQCQELASAMDQLRQLARGQDV